MSAYGEVVVQHSRTVTGRDGDGNDVWSDADITHPKATLYPRVAVELVQGQDTNIIGLVAVFNPAITVTATDEFTARGERWKVDGYPGQYVSPHSGRAITKLNLTRITG